MCISLQMSLYEHFGWYFNIQSAMSYNVQIHNFSDLVMFAFLCKFPKGLPKPQPKRIFFTTLSFLYLLWVQNRLYYRIVSQFFLDRQISIHPLISSSEQALNLSNFVKKSISDACQTIESAGLSRLLSTVLSLHQAHYSLLCSSNKLFLSQNNY